MSRSLSRQLSLSTCSALVHQILSTIMRRVMPTRLVTVLLSTQNCWRVNVPTVAPAWTRGRMNPVTTIRISLLLY